MRRSALIGALAALAGLAGGAAAEDRRPNVVVIFTDDQGSVDAGCYGSGDLRTPAIDALAAGGVRFTQLCAAAPVCSPSRAGLLTGRYPVRAGMPGNTSSMKGDPGMPTEMVTMAEAFRGAGYATAHVGKWHLGFTPETMPNGQGFDFSFGFMGGCIDNYSHFNYWRGPNRHDLWINGAEVQDPGSYFPDLMVEHAARFIDEHADRPFFMYFAINNPHYPYQGEPEQLASFADLPYPRDLYAAFVASMDERIGGLLGVIEAAGLTDDTIVVLQSDHGHSTEERAHYGGGSAGPYRGAKFSLFEGGLRVPAVIRWPGHLPAGEVRDQLAHGCDWFPTLLDLCEIPSDGLDLDGLSLVPVLRDPDAPTPHEVTHWQVGRGNNAQWAVRRGPWKLIGNPRDTTNGRESPDLGPRFLSNLDRDVSEATNLLHDHTDVARELEALHREWIEAVEAESH